MPNLFYECLDEHVKRFVSSPGCPPRQPIVSIRFELKFKHLLDQFPISEGENLQDSRPPRPEVRQPGRKDVTVLLELHLKE